MALLVMVVIVIGIFVVHMVGIRAEKMVTNAVPEVRAIGGIGRTCHVAFRLVSCGIAPAGRWRPAYRPPRIMLISCRRARRADIRARFRPSA